METKELEVQHFAQKIGAISKTVENSRCRSLYDFQETDMLIKISRTSKPFWGLPGKILDDFLSKSRYFYCVFLVSEDEGWLYSQRDVQHMIQSGKWKKSNNDYKVNPPHADKLQFCSLERFRTLLSGRV